MKGWLSSRWGRNEHYVEASRCGVMISRVKWKHLKITRGKRECFFGGGISAATALRRPAPFSAPPGFKRDADCLVVVSSIESEMEPIMQNRHGLLRRPKMLHSLDPPHSSPKW